MPTRTVQHLIDEVRVIKDSLEMHLKEGVDIKLAIARIQTGHTYLKTIGVAVLLAIAGLYLK